ncbi:DUF2635 domain-containing protein [Pseudomonas oryziphila]|uniref:DUF2635 domain-containing protein n=1 Tax=Pseudomonas entomophila TaxID=312306 RepID=A0A3Q8U0R4_9PSED|nr:DUF2635 domain-containing protein [Pseudomonas oryziphila]AZL68787.1 DUF2635 domain-containing protein [Pseudomonas oryziphila]
MKMVQLKPAPGRACPMPEKGGELLPEAGDTVPHDAYWQRRIEDGDALLVKQKPAAKAVKEPKA